MEPENTLGFARNLADAGLSVIPIRADGSKAPAIAWKPYQQQRATDDELRSWLTNGYGLGIVGGQISENLEVLDFDVSELWSEFETRCTEHTVGELLASLPLVETPSGGKHLYARCTEPVSGNTPLAWKLLSLPEEAERFRKGAKLYARWDGKEYPVVMRDGQEQAVTIGIETRGEGGYALARGSPASCHPAGRPYCLLRGDLTAIPVITPGELQMLHALAAVLSEYVDEATVRGHTESKPGAGRLLPGADYNCRGDVLSELERQGYQIVGKRGETVLLKRPGKTEPGLSATFGYGGSRVFYSFSTNDPYFQARTPYSPFAAYACLHSGGDFKEAAAQLSAQGYGEALPQPRVSASSAFPSFGKASASTLPPVLERLPDPLNEAAYYGLAGEFVRLVEPQTESDPVAILIQFLAAFGNVIDRHAYAQVEATRHYMTLFAVLVGQTAKARKGTSLNWIRTAFERVDSLWEENRMQSGLSSGEGLLHAVRDPVVEQVPIKEKGRITGYQELTKDHGEEDKRLLVTESEFARTLKVMEREGNTLSALLRDAWDTGNLRVMTKTAQKATGAHISIIAHITREELRRLMTDTALVNGFANRFLWFVVQRSKLLPEGGHLDERTLEPLLERLREAVEFAQTVKRMERNSEARGAWERVYPELTREVPGLLGAVTSRADPQVLRLSCLYALLDKSSIVRIEHLRAASALWEYAEQSAAYIFGDALGDPVADALLQALRGAPNGLTRREISDLFGRNQRAERLAEALNVLQGRGLAACRQEETGGRPAEVWQAAAQEGQSPK